MTEMPYDEADQPEADQPEVTPLTAPADGVPPVLSRPSDFARAARELAAGSGPIAIDTERASGFRYSQRAYLVQLRRAGAGSYLLDPIEHPDALTPVLAALDGPEWILHAADQDLPCLRELGFHCATVFDTELAGRLLNLPKVNLASMVAHFLHLGLVKGHGAADWSRRPLPPEWLNYAALDVEVLVELRSAIAAELAATGRDEWAAEEFAYALRRAPHPPRADRWRRTSNIHTLRDTRSLAVVRELWTTREQVAADRDIAPGRVLPDTAIITAATAKPDSVGALTRLPVFGGPRQRRRAQTWMSAISRAMDLPDADLPSRKAVEQGLPAVGRWQQQNPAAATRLRAVRARLTEVAEQIGVPAENLLAPDVVRRLCWDGLGDTSPSSVDDWLTAHDARSWQRGLTAVPVADALSGT